MGEVFLARVEGAAGFEKRVVIKRILPHLAESDEFVERFLDEGRLVVQLNHGNIVQVLDMGEVEGNYYLAMEYVDGLDLRALLHAMRRDGAKLPVALAMHIVAELSKGLSHAHNLVDDLGERLNVIHRDISPANVMVSRAGEVKLLDFGIAKVAARTEQSITGALHGKFLYMSPEQAAARALDHRSDLFSLGSLAYELLTGLRPFNGESELQTLDLIRSGVHRTVRQERSEVPGEVEAIVERCLQIDPDKRYQSADGLQRAILAWFVESKTVVSSSDLVDHLAPYLPLVRGNQPASLDDALQQQLDQLLISPVGRGSSRPSTVLSSGSAVEDIERASPDDAKSLSDLTVSRGVSAQQRLVETADKTVSAASRNRIFLWSIGLLVFVLVSLNIIMINTFSARGEPVRAQSDSLAADASGTGRVAEIRAEPASNVPATLGAAVPRIQDRPNQDVVNSIAQSPTPSSKESMSADIAAAAAPARYGHPPKAQSRPLEPPSARPRAASDENSLGGRGAAPTLLRVRGLPNGAVVRVDGERVRSDALQRRGWTVPGHETISLDIRAPGYEPWSQELERVDGVLNVEPVLRAKTSVVQLTVNPSNAAIRGPGKQLLGLGKADITVTSNTSRRVRIEAKGYEAETLTIRYGMRSKSVALKPKTVGEITVMVFPATATVMLDGKTLSRNSIRVRKKLAPGQHTLRAEFQGKSVTRRFRVNANEKTLLEAIRLIR